MGQILVWECEHTGQLFREEKDYRSNARKVKHQMVLEERARRKKEEEVARLQPMYQRSTFRALEKWILDHAALVRNFGRGGFGRDRDEGNLVAVHFYDMRWGDQSCSHSAPLGKRTNWCGTGEGPKTYPGWHGRIVLWFDGHCSRFSDSLTPIGICTGSGGTASDSGKTKRYPKGYCLSYDVTLWADDFPKLVPRSIELLDSSGWGSRTLASMIHDVYHFDRSTTRHKIEHWGKFLATMELIRKNSGGKNLTKYCPLWDDNRREREINFASRALVKEYPYIVYGELDRKQREKIEYRNRQFAREARFLGRMGGMPILTSDPDPFVGFKLSGDLSPNSMIIDLRKRAEALAS